MKTLTKYFSLLVIAAGFLTPAFAQRSGHGGGAGNQGARSNSRQTYSSPRQNSSPVIRQNRQNFSPRQNNSNVTRQSRQNSPVVNRGGVNSSSSYSRNRFSGNNNSVAQRGNRGGLQNNPPRVNNSYRGGNNAARGGYGQRGGYPSRYNYSPRRWGYTGYQHYSFLPRTSISIYFGGFPYYYYGGLFYGYYNGFYEPVYAPFGIRVSMLPYGYYPFYIGSIPYYYYNGIYYRSYDDSQYEVVDAPMGAVVTDLPKGATVAIINGEKFYEFNGTYYKEGTNSKNQVVYTVVGKYGEINNSNNNQDNISVNPPDGQDAVTPDQKPLQMGDIITTLPDNSRQVTLNGEVLFVSPDNIYFKQRVVDGAAGYEVVGTNEKKP